MKGRLDSVTAVLPVHLSRTSALHSEERGKGLHVHKPKEKNPDNITRDICNGEVNLEFS